MTTDDEPLFAYPAAHRKMFMLDWTRGQMIVGVAFAVVALVGGYIGQAITTPVLGGLFAVVVLIIGFAVIDTPFLGEPITEWAARGITWTRDGGPRRRHSWRANTAGAGRVVSHAGHAQVVYEPTPPAPLRDVALVSHTRAGYPWGLIRDVPGRRWVAAAEVVGHSFTLQDPGERTRMFDSWWQVLSDVSEASGLIHRFQWTTYSVPDDGTGLWDEYRRRVARHDTVAAANLRELIGGFSGAPTAQSTIVSVGIDPTRVPRRRLAGDGPLDVRIGAVATAVMSDLTAGVQRADLHVTDPFLSPSRYAEVIRSQYDPALTGALNVYTSAHPRGERVDPETLWPVATDESWSWYRTDSAYHMLFYIERYPVSPRRGDFLAQFDLAIGWPHAISVVYEPLDVERSITEAEEEAHDAAAEEEAERRAGIHPPLRRVRRRESARRREAELQDGAEFAIGGWVRVTAPPDEQDGPAHAYEAAEQATKAALAKGLRLRPMWGQQARAFAATLPLCRGIGASR